MLAGVNDKRGAGAVAVVQHAHRVAESRHDVQLEKGRPARSARVAIGDTGSYGFLQRQNVLDLRIVLEGVDESLLGGTGIAEDVLRPLGEELLKHCVPPAQSGHRLSPFAAKDSTHGR